MSRFKRAAELAKKVLGTDRNLRNQEIKMNRMLPNRYENVAETVLKPKGRDYEKFSRAADARIDKVLAEQGIPMKPQRGGLLGAAKARGMISPKTESDIRRVVGTGAATAGGALALGTKGFNEPYDAQNMVIDPAAIGAIAARMGKSISEAVVLHTKHVLQMHTNIFMIVQI